MTRGAGVDINTRASRINPPLNIHSQHPGPGRRRDTRDSGDDLLRAEAELLAGLVARYSTVLEPWIVDVINDKVDDLNSHAYRWRARQPPPRPRAIKRSDLYGFIKKTVVPFPRLG